MHTCLQVTWREFENERNLEKDGAHLIYQKMTGKHRASMLSARKTKARLKKAKNYQWSLKRKRKMGKMALR